jgi:hypothetical protein
MGFMARPGRKSYGTPLARRALSGFENRPERQAWGPPGRICAQVFDNGEAPVDSAPSPTILLCCRHLFMPAI